MKDKLPDILSDILSIIFISFMSGILTTLAFQMWTYMLLNILGKIK